MTDTAPRTAIIIGASSGIGEALARRLAAEGWTLGLMARRMERLDALAAALDAVAALIDLDDAAAARQALAALLDRLGGAELVVLSAGTGHRNPTLDWAPERETIAVNALGFAAVAQVAMAHFLARGGGHLVGISSVAKLRGSGEAPAYAASKAFVSTYLDGLRDLAKRRGVPVAVTEIAPGFVDTAMMKADRPFWVATPARAAAQIHTAIRRRARHAYVTRRWALIGFLLRRLPAPG